MYLGIIVWLLLILFSGILERTDASPKDSTVLTAPRNPHSMSSNHEDVRIVFSDVDGTLVHYPEESIDPNNSILRLPPSTTGMQGIISSQTLDSCQAIREKGVKLVLVSGMRTSTLLKRLPFLPQADAYCSEAGGRIFYRKNDNKRKADNPNKQTFKVAPQYSYNEENKEQEAFEIVEDLEWRSRMEDQKAAGADGYAGAELDLQTSKATPVPIEDRKGALWDFARQLIAKGYVLDTRGYASCFRVNRKQQTKVSTEEFEALLGGKVLSCPPELGTSLNLGCIDYYPVESGKKNCCQYLASKFLEKPSSPELLSAHCICLCDDDNDLEMAMACQHAFIPGISSESMAKRLSDNPGHFSQTGGADHKGIEGTLATEKALALALEFFLTQ